MENFYSKANYLYERADDEMNSFLKEKISDYLSRITPFGFTGTVLVASEKEIIHSQGYGLANKKENVENNTTTYHDIGSVTKQFTAAGILKLEMDGKLTTDDHIDQFFPEVPTDKKNITLHQLLTHTSGICDSDFDDYELVTKDQALQRIFANTTKTGNPFSYSNDGYTLLAAIIEEVSGQGYEEYLYNHLFVPSNMLETGYTIPNFNEDKIAIGYTNGIDCGKPTDKNYPYWNLIGNGGMLSTAHDLYKWHCELLGDNILSKAAKEKLFTPNKRDYAYGWKVYNTSDGKVIEHGGASSYGTCAIFRRLIDKGHVIIVLCNQFLESSNQMAKSVSDKLSKLIFGQDVSVPPLLTPQHDNSEFDEIGSFDYQLLSGGHFSLNFKKNKLELIADDQNSVQFFITLENEQEYINKITELSNEITKDLIRGSYKTLEMNMENHDLFLERKSMIDNYLSKIIPKSSKPIGSLPSTIFPETYEVRFRLIGEEDYTLLYFWKNERIQFLGFSGGLGPLKLDCVKNGESYISYSIEYESAITFAFGQAGMETIEFISPKNTAKRV